MHEISVIQTKRNDCNVLVKKETTHYEIIAKFQLYAEITVVIYQV